MKKIHLVLFTLLAITNSFAQNHKLTTDRNAYRAADQIIKQQVEFKDPGNSGKNLTWDFRIVQPINEEYTLDYFIPDSTDMARLCGIEHNTRYYYRQQNDSLQAVGYENSTTYMQYVIPEMRMHFPFAYGDTLFSNFEGIGQYSHFLELFVKGYTRVQVDAEGKLLLPQSETVKKALRVHTLRHYTETGKDSVEMTLDIYSWYASGIRYPVFESMKTTLNRKLFSPQGEGVEGLVDTTVFSTSFYYPPEKQTSQIETEPIPTDSLLANQGASSVFTEAQLMPNPVVDYLYINYKLTRPAKVWFTLHNNIGVAQCSTSHENMSDGYNTTTINMSAFMTGTYMLYVHLDDMIMMQRVIVKK